MSLWTMNIRSEGINKLFGTIAEIMKAFMGNTFDRKRNKFEGNIQIIKRIC